MNAPIATGAQGFLARFEGLRTRLPGDPAPREAAAETLRALGLPGRRDEAWHYTNLRPVAEAAFHEPLTPLIDCAALLARVPSVGTRLVFVDGRFRADLSGTPAGAAFTPFATNAAFGPLARPDRDPLVALNTMLAEDGAVISVAANTDGGTIELINLATDTPGRPTAFHPRHLIRLGAGARLTLLDVALGEGTYLHNPVTEIEVADGATPHPRAPAGRSAVCLPPRNDLHRRSRPAAPMTASPSSSAAVSRAPKSTPSSPVPGPSRT